MSRSSARLCTRRLSLRCPLRRGESEAPRWPGAPDSGRWPREAAAAGSVLGSRRRGRGEEGGPAAPVARRECLFGEGAGRAGLLDT